MLGGCFQPGETAWCPTQQQVAQVLARLFPTSDEQYAQGIAARAPGLLDADLYIHMS